MPRTRVRAPAATRLRHGHARQIERQRAIVVAELADAILAPEHRHAARRLDGERIGAVAEIEKIGRGDHRRRS